MLAELILNAFSDPETVFTWMDKHAGSLSFLATIVLAAVTALYVWFTYGLFRAQQTPLRREVVDEVLPDLQKELRGAIYGAYSVDRLLTHWRKLRHDKSAIVYSRVFPRKVRSDMDRLVDGPTTWYDDYEVIAAAAKEQSLEHPPAGLKRPDQKAYPGTPYNPLWTFAIRSFAPGGSVEDYLPIKVSEYVWTNESQLWNGQEYISREVLKTKVVLLLGRIDSDPDLKPAVARHRKLRQDLLRIGRELQKYRERVV
jgi:hypothetical protein